MNHASDSFEKNLTGNEAAEKIRQIVTSARVCFFGTSKGHVPLEVRPMNVQEIDSAGVLWFLSGRSSIKNAHIAHNARVQLLFANPGNSEYLNLTGLATITDERRFRERFWTPLAETWFPGGVDDPELTVIQVRPNGGHYWNTETGKAFSMLQLAVGAVTGMPMDIGVEGAIRP